MKKDWFISHSCHTKEPFGYSIFQSIDYGKLPIIHSDWGDVDYKYKASNKKAFNYIVNQIQKESCAELNDNSKRPLVGLYNAPVGVNEPLTALSVAVTNLCSKWLSISDGVITQSYLLIFIKWSRKSDSNR